MKPRLILISVYLVLILILIPMVIERWEGAITGNAIKEKLSFIPTDKGKLFTLKDKLYINLEERWL